MPVFKNESNGTWYVMARYVNWKGERKQKCKRGFSTKKEAQEWERMFQLQNSSDMDMSFEAFTELYAIMTAFAKTGLVAVIDEVTGYQADRDRDELQKVLEKYISAELLPWAKRFPDEFYAAVPKDELKQYQNTFIFFSKVRRSVKIRYCDAIDNREYEPLMQNLLDTHLSVAGLKQITNPIDILNKDDFERELEELGSLRAKADAITSKLTRSISEKYHENPAYYDSFSKRIKDALDQYKEKVISEAEYLAKMRTIMEDYHAGKSSVTYPESIKNNVHAQAFYGVLSAVFDEAKEAEVSPDFVAEIAEEITKIVADHSQVDWTNNKTIHDRISQDIDDLFYDYEKERGLKLSFDTIDKIIENVKTVALRRF